MRTSRLAVVAEVADRFRQARRVLNHVADRYLMGPGTAWFTGSGSVSVPVSVPGQVFADVPQR